MASEFVEIKTSFAHILDMAGRLRDQGEELTKAVTGLIQRIEELEKHPKVFPDDDFARTFKLQYEKPMDDGVGHQVAMNKAVLNNAAGIGDGLRSMGQFVADVMPMYQGQDEENADAMAAEYPTT